MHLPVPYYQADGITLYCGDVRSIAPLLDPVDAIVTDPPYERTSLAWDVWPEGWPKLVLPLSQQLWCFGSLITFWEHHAEFSVWKMAQDLVWEKHNGSGLHNDRFRRVHEFAVHFYRGKWTSLPLTPPIVSIVEDRHRGKLRSKSKPAHFADIGANYEYEYDGTRLCRSVIRVPSCHGYAVNETQKPEGIIEPIVSYSVPMGGTLLDLFAGSGTTLAVARAQGKRAIGIELRESQCAEIVERLRSSLALTYQPTK